MISIMEMAVATAMRRVDREASMKRVFSGILAAVLALAAPAALAQGKPPLKLGGILDMSGLYADITGAGSETAAKMAAEDFGGDTINTIKQASEFGLMKGGQKLSPLLAFVTDIDSVGLETAQGLLLSEAFYWDLNDETRAFSKRFMDRIGRVPSAAQAGVYSSVLHYLKAVKAAGTTDSAAVMKIMRETPINDMFAKNGRIREDGRMVHDMYLFEVKKPSESKGRWDDYKLIATIPGNEAFQSLELSRCPLLKKKS
jgi:branched-chain amino acid transport system substrate-binding protein